MFELYTDNARRAVFVARGEASRFGSPQIETEHLLLGLLIVDPDCIAPLLREGENAETIRARVEERTPKQPPISTSVDMPLSEAFAQLLTGAAEESLRLNNGLIGTQHLVVALLTLENDPAAVLLTDAGATLQAARDQLEKLPIEELRRRGQQLNPAMQEYMRKRQRPGQG